MPLWAFYKSIRIICLLHSTKSKAVIKGAIVMNKPWLNICPVCGACNTHLPNCPEYEKLIPAQCRCTECGNGIENGESYYQIGEHIICNYCIDDFKHIMDMDDYSYEDYLTEKYERERDDV